MVALGDVAEIDRVGVDPATLAPETHYLGLEHIERGGRIIGCGTVSGAGLTSTKFKFTTEHVLYGKLRPNLGKVSRPTSNGVCSTDILPIRPGERLDRDYLAHYLVQPGMVRFAASQATGANLPRLKPSTLANFHVPLPTLEEQRRIAAILDHADALRAKRRQVLAHLDSLTQSQFVESFRGVTARSALRDLGVDFLSGKNVLGADTDAHPVNRVIKVSAISGGTFRPSESKPMPADYTPPESHRLTRGDILFGRASGSLDLLGATAMVDCEPIDLFLPDKVWRLVIAPEAPVVPAYILGVLRSADARAFIRHRASGAAGVRNISKARLLGYRAPVPPPARQREFAARVAAIDAQRAVAVRALAADDELFVSLQSRAFRGEL